MEDVAVVIRAAANSWDAILLDVDNGPGGDGASRAMTRCISPPASDAAWQALRPGGVFTVWSSLPDPAFTRRLKPGRALR